MGKPTFLNSENFKATSIDGITLMGGSAANVLNFSIESQKQTNWCWAAVSKSVALYYSKTPHWTQCEVATKALKLEIGNIPCCASPTNQKCNIPWYLGRALDVVGAFKKRVDKAESLSTVKNEISNDNPLCVRVGWRTGGGHFLAILGWKETTNVSYLEIDDPIHGRQTIKETKFRNNYRGSGTWTHSYFVKSPTIGGSDDEILIANNSLKNDIALGA